jgi:sec-independent protein translocase protein TatA
MGLGVPELLILAFVVVLLFGAGRISRIAGELGLSIRTFREGLGGEDAAED